MPGNAGAPCSRAASPADGPVYHIDLDARPADLSEGFGRSRTWNIRILNLMARAKLIDLRIPEAPAARRRGRRCVARPPGGVLRRRAGAGRHLADRRPDERLQLISRQRSPQPGAGSWLPSGTALAQLRAALRGDQCISEVLAAYYVVDRPEGPLLTSPWCRGCPHCRQRGTPDGFCRAGWQPHPTVAPWPYRDDPLAAFRGASESCLSIWWDSEQERRDLLPELATQALPGRDARHRRAGHRHQHGGADPAGSPAAPGHPRR